MTDKEFYRLQKKLDNDIQKIIHHTDLMEKHSKILLFLFAVLVFALVWLLA